MPIYTYVHIYAFDPDRIRNLYLKPRAIDNLRVIEVVQ